MVLKRMDNIGIVVEDLGAMVEFLRDLGLELEGEGVIEGSGLDARTPDGHGRVELSRFLAPRILADHRNAPMNALGYLRVMFTVDDIDETLNPLQKHGARLVGEVVQ